MIDVSFCLYPECFTVFLEKVLRVQPNVKKLYLLLRAADAKSATHRLHNEVQKLVSTQYCFVLYVPFLSLSLLVWFERCLHIIVMPCSLSS